MVSPLLISLAGLFSDQVSHLFREPVLPGCQGETRQVPGQVSCIFQCVCLIAFVTTWGLVS